MSNKKQLLLLYVLVCVLVTVVVVMYMARPKLEKAEENREKISDIQIALDDLQLEISCGAQLEEEIRSLQAEIDRDGIVSEEKETYEILEDVSVILRQKGYEITSASVGEKIPAEEWDFDANTDEQEASVTSDTEQFREAESSGLFVTEMQISIAGEYESLEQAFEEIKNISGVYPCDFKGSFGSQNQVYENIPSEINGIVIVKCITR